MATTQLTELPVREQFQQKEVTPPPKQSSGRLVSLDAYRGFIMLMLVSEGFGFGALKGHASWAWLARQLAGSLPYNAGLIRSKDWPEPEAKAGQGALFW